MAVADQTAATNLYRIEATIGTGGMGTVYRALDVQLNRRVALKVLNSAEGDLLDRFLREQQITAELDHPGFVRILSIGYLEDADGGRPFYTMPLIRGLTLEELIKRRRRRDAEGEQLRGEFTLTRLLQLMQQICLTLQSAHDKRIVHRDLKPANIILGPYGEVYVTDLGLAKHLGGRAGETSRFEAHVMRQLARMVEVDLTRDEMMGTPYYMAPEQSLSPRTVDHRADIFGLGALLYYVLTGQRPKYAETGMDPNVMETRKGDLVAQLRARGVDPTQRRPRVAPPDVQALLAAYDEVQGILTGSTFHKFRFLMKECTILPPREGLAAAAGPGKDGGETPVDPIDDALEAICMKALAKNPNDRYDSCREMWKELQQYAERRHDLILKRRGGELARAPFKSAAPAALVHLDQAARTLQEAISRNEDLGRMGIEDRLELFDVLLGKAKLNEARGDQQAILRDMARAEPMIESTLAVLERQFLQVLLSKGAALFKQARFEEAAGVLRRAREMARDKRHPDLLREACFRYGLALTKQAGEEESEEGLRALRTALVLAKELGDASGAGRARVALARCLPPTRAGQEEARNLLDEAIRQGQGDPALLSEVHAALSAWHLARGDAAEATREAEEAHRRAVEADAPADVRGALLALGQAHHLAGDASGRARAFREIVRSNTERHPAALRDVRAFYDRNHLDIGELER